MLAANLMPLAGVLFWQWSVSSVIVLYWFENIVIGLINVARMALSEGQFDRVVKVGLIPFFVFHYFFFCAGHGVFVFGMFPDDSGYFMPIDGISLLATLGRAIEIFRTPLALAALALTLSHLISFIVNYVGGGEFRRLDLRQLMFMPYSRIVVLHITILLGAFVTMALDDPIWVIVILVLVKIGVDLKMHIAEHLKVSPAP